MIRGLRTTLFGLILACSATLGAQEAEMDKVAARLAVKIASLPDATVAVVDFTDLQGRVTELGRYYAEELSIALVNAPGGFKVIDRGHLKALLAEHKFQTSGVVDEKTAAELGRIAGVNILITGTVTDIEGSLRLAVKALNTKSAAIQAAVSVSLVKSDATSALLHRDVSNLNSNPSAAGSATRARGALDVRMFQNDFLIVGVDSISVRKDRDRLYAYITLSLENKSSREEYLACNGSSVNGVPKASIMDSEGRSWRADQITGLPTTHHYNYSKHTADEFTRLAPGARQTVIVPFWVESKGSESISSVNVSFAMEMFRFRETAPGKVEIFSVGFTGIPMGRR